MTKKLVLQTWNSISTPHVPSSKWQPAKLCFPLLFSIQCIAHLMYCSSISSRLSFRPVTSASSHQHCDMYGIHSCYSANKDTWESRCSIGYRRKLDEGMIIRVLNILAAIWTSSSTIGIVPNHKTPSYYGLWCSFELQPLPDIPLIILGRPCRPTQRFAMEVTIYVHVDWRKRGYHDFRQ